MGVAVDLVAGGATRWQVHGLRWQERVVGVGQGSLQDSSSWMR